MIQCHDRLSGEQFEVSADCDVEAAIEAYIRAGIDSDTGAVDYDVATDDGQHYRGTVSPE